MSEIIVTEQPARIGILLDYNAGRLLFLNAERGQLLSAIRYKFTKAAYPVFVLEQSGFLNLHTGMELPEFVKQSWTFSSESHTKEEKKEKEEFGKKTW